MHISCYDKSISKMSSSRFLSKTRLFRLSLYYNCKQVHVYTTSVNRFSKSHTLAEELSTVAIDDVISMIICKITILYNYGSYLNESHGENESHVSPT